MMFGMLVLLAAAFALGLFVGYLVWHPVNTVTVVSPTISPGPLTQDPPPTPAPQGDLSDIAKKLAEEYKK